MFKNKLIIISMCILMLISGILFSLKNSLLMLGAITDNVICINLSLFLGANVNFKNKKNYSPLFFAAAYDNLEAVKKLLEKGANIDITNGTDELTPLTASMQSCHRKTLAGNENILIASFVLEKKAREGRECENQVFNFLLEKGANIDLKNRFGHNALFTAFYYSVPDWMAGKLASISKDSPKKIFAVLKRFDTFSPATVKALLERGVSPRSPELLIKAFGPTEEDAALVLSLIKKGADVNQKLDGIPALALAMRTKNNTLIKHLINNGANINKSYKSSYYYKSCGHNPLTEAICNKNYEIAEFLLKKGASVNDSSYGVASPLVLAVENNNADFAKILIQKYGAKINHYFYKNPLTISLENKNSELAAWLIKKGANVNGDDESDKPLIVATENGFEDIVKLLLKKGAKSDIINSSGQDLEEIATQNGFYNIANIFKDVKEKTKKRTYKKCLFDNAITHGIYDGHPTFVYNDKVCQIGDGGRGLVCKVSPGKSSGTSSNCTKGGQWFTCADTDQGNICCYNEEYDCVIREEQSYTCILSSIEKLCRRY